MAYITNGDIEKWIGTAVVLELTDDSGSGSADSTLIDAARLGAEGEADSYLATRYRVPVEVSSEPAVHATLRAFVLDLAAYRLHGRRPPVPADVVRRREEAVTWLSRVASGLVQLPAAAAVAENGALGLLGQSAGPNRSMTRETLGEL